MLQTDAGPAILDEMKLELTDMKISKVVVSKVDMDSNGLSHSVDLGKKSQNGPNDDQKSMGELVHIMYLN